MQWKKQMIKTSLVAFGLSIGVGLTGASSAFATLPENSLEEQKNEECIHFDCEGYNDVIFFKSDSEQNKKNHEEIEYIS